MPVIERNAETLSNATPDRILGRELQLTNAQITALNGTPQTLVPAPGAGLAIVVETVDFFFKSSGAYTIGTANMKVEYASGADIIDVTEAGFLDQATDQLRTYLPAVGAFTPVANSAVRLINEVANFTGGNAANTLRIVARYRIIPAAQLT